jgi:putative solute:sodium symporter small subunit
MSDSADAQQRAAAHWRRTRRLALSLAAAWAVITFVPPFFAQALAGPWLGAPLAVWIAAQVAPLAYVLLAWWYERRADRIDREQQDSDGA